MERWSSKKPTEPGFYWVRSLGYDLKNKKYHTTQTIVQVEMGHSGLVVWVFGSECETELDTYVLRDSSILNNLTETIRWKKVASERRVKHE